MLLRDVRNVSRKMDMTPPNVKFVTLKEEMEYLGESMEVDELVQITFNLEIGDLLQSKMYQILPIYEAKEMVRRLLYPMVEEEIATEEIEEEKIVEPVVQPIEFKEVKQMEPVYGHVHSTKCRNEREICIWKYSENDSRYIKFTRK